MKDKHGVLLSDDPSDHPVNRSRAHDSSEYKYNVVQSSQGAAALHVHGGSVFHSANSKCESAQHGCVGPETSLGGSACRKEDSKAFSASLS